MSKFICNTIIRNTLRVLLISNGTPHHQTPPCPLLCEAPSRIPTSVHLHMQASSQSRLGCSSAPHESSSPTLIGKTACAYCGMTTLCSVLQFMRRPAEHVHTERAATAFSFPDASIANGPIIMLHTMPTLQHAPAYPQAFIYTCRLSKPPRMFQRST